MLIFALILTILMITVMITDVTRFLIPNWLVGCVLLTYPFFLYFNPASPDWKWELLIALACFIAGLALFYFNALGGGDVKLLAAVALFTGKEASGDFIMIMGFLGGIMAFMLLFMRPLMAYIWLKSHKDKSSLPKLFGEGEPIPYGVAIALAFLIVMFAGEIPGITGHYVSVPK